MLNNDDAIVTDITAELDGIQPTEAPPVQEFSENADHFDQEEPADESPIDAEPVPQMTPAQYKSFAKNIISMADNTLVGIVDSKLYFKKYCGDIPAAALVECERIYNLITLYNEGKKDQRPAIDTDIEAYYSQYAAYQKKISSLHLSPEEIKATADPLAMVLKQKLPEMSPMTSLVFALSMSFGSRALTVFADTRI
jgi:hypothetical protein